MNIPLPPKNARIKYLVNHFANGKVTKFVELLNENGERVSQPQINRLFHVEKRNDQNKYPSVSSAIIDAIIDRFENDIDPMWLISGTGSPPIEPVSQEQGKGINQTSTEMNAGTTPISNDILNRILEGHLKMINAAADQAAATKIQADATLIREKNYADLIQENKAFAAMVIPPAEDSAERKARDAAKYIAAVELINLIEQGKKGQELEAALEDLSKRVSPGR